MKKLFLLLLVFLLLLSGCGKTILSRATFKESVEYGGYYVDGDKCILLLALSPELQAEMGLDAYVCDACGENVCGHLSAPMEPDAPDFAQLPEVVQGAALQFQKEPPDPYMSGDREILFQLVRFPYTYLKELHAKLVEEWTAEKDDPESFWYPVRKIQLREGQNAVGIVFIHELPATNVPPDMSTLIPRFRKAGIVSDAVCYEIEKFYRMNVDL